jgi:hypothetical protein
MNLEAIAPYYTAVAVTPSDVETIPLTIGLYVGTAGNLTVTMAGGNDVTFPSCPAGFHPLQLIAVLATGTPATGIVALY